MKKFVLFLGFLLSLCANAQADDTVNKKEFVNPIFYQPLKPLARTSTWTYLTPTSIISMTPLDRNKADMTGQCELIENQQDHITMVCDILFLSPKMERGKKHIISFALKELLTPSCLVVEETYRSINEREGYSSTCSYCFTPPDYVKSESD